MRDYAKARTVELQTRLGECGLPAAVIAEQSSIAYLAGFWGYLGMEFGRPTLLVVPAGEPPIVITPAMESEMVAKMSWIDDVRPWNDSGTRPWRALLADALKQHTKAVGIEAPVLPAPVREALVADRPDRALVDISEILGRMRMIKSAEEIAIMRQAGKIAGAMMSAAERSLSVGVPEYEVALAISNAGTRKAAEMLTDRGWESLVSPIVHGLQIMQSGPLTSMVHRRAGIRRLSAGDPVYFCFCNLVEFKHYRLGFDRVFFLGEPSREAARVQETANEAQQAALAKIRPGVRAAEIAAAANDVYRRNGFAPGYRTGRSIGVAYLESPELKEGDETELVPNMTFAVDGGVTVPGKLGGRIGDSIVVTETGFDYLTDYRRDLLVI